MGTATVPYGRSTQKAPAVKEVHILWITAGLGCDGDSVSITAATQPSIEDVLLGAIPGLAKGASAQSRAGLRSRRRLHEVFLSGWEGKLEPFVLVVEGSIPNEKIKKEGYWAALGTDPKTKQPITTNEWIDRLAPEGLGGDCHRNLRHLWRHSCHGRQSHRLHGSGRLSRLGLAVQSGLADRECSGMSGAA